MIKNIINLEKKPYIPLDGWKVESHTGKGKWEWNPKEVELYLSEKQKTEYIGGNDLRKELENQPVLNANVLDYLYENQELIPDSWKDKYVYFWGTIYRYSDDILFVRYLYFHDGRWYRHYRWLDYDWDGNYPAALLAQVSSPQPLESLPLNFESRLLELEEKMDKLIAIIKI